MTSNQESADNAQPSANADGSPVIIQQSTCNSPNPKTYNTELQSSSNIEAGDKSAKVNIYKEDDLLNKEK